MAAKTCPNCKKFLKGEFTFCPHCGAKLAEEAPKPEPVKPVEVKQAPVKPAVVHSSAAEVKKNADSDRFNDQFKKSLIFELIGNALTVVFGLCVLFIPFLVNEYKGKDGAMLSENLSLFKLAIIFIKSIESLGLGFILIYDFIIALFILVMIISAGVALGKNIVNLTKIDQYCLLRYDNLLNRVEEKSRWRSRREYNSFSFLASTLVLVIFAIIYDRLPYVGTHWFDGVNASIAVLAITLIGAGVFTILKMRINAKVKNAYLNDVYQKRR